MHPGRGASSWAKTEDEGQAQSEHRDKRGTERGNNHRLEFALFVRLSPEVNPSAEKRPRNYEIEDPPPRPPLAVAVLFLLCHRIQRLQRNRGHRRRGLRPEQPGRTRSGAEVRLFAVGSVDQTFIGELRFDTTQVTNAAGSVSFNFSEYYKQGQAGFAVLDIEATKGSLTGIGIIKIEEEMTNEQTVIME